MAYNLPPGVTESMIPGNTPDDQLDEQILDDLFGAMQAVGVRIERDDVEDELADKFVEIVRKHMAEAERAALQEARLWAQQEQAD